MGLWRNDEGRVRSGFGIALFAAVAVIVSGALNLAAAAADLFPGSGMSLDQPRVLVSTLINLASALTATAVLWRVTRESPGASRPSLLLPGALAGAALVSLTVAIGALASGTLAFARCDGKLTTGVLELLFVGPTAVAEEFWLRGSAFRALARGTHPAVAITGTGIVFGALHLFNPGATWVAAVNVALVGFWFGALAWKAQSLWLPIGAHLAWNWFEGFFWGQNVSGIRAACSLFTATAQPPFWGGGPFGPEASGLTAVLLALATLLTLLWPSRAAA